MLCTHDLNTEQLSVWTSFSILLPAPVFRKDDWPDKRMAMDDRYSRSDLPRQERYQDFDHRDRGRYQDNIMMDRRDNARGIGADRDGQVKSSDSPPSNYSLGFKRRCCSESYC